MNFRKAKVSKAVWLPLLVLGLLGTAPAPSPLPSVTAQTAHASLLASRDPAGQVRVTGGCANARRELRFEMLSVTEPYPPPRRNPVVCLAVYRPSDRR